MWSSRDSPPEVGLVGVRPRLYIVVDDVVPVDVVASWGRVRSGPGTEGMEEPTGTGDRRRDSE